MNSIHQIMTGMALTLCTLPAVAAFDECKFNFGRMWSNQFNASTSFSGQGLSHLSIWVGDKEEYNQYWEGDLAKAAKSNNLTPVIYAYVIAEYGKDNGLKDCDMGSPNHCTDGARMIRNNWSQILQRYSSYAAGIASDYGTSNPTIWLIEPDYLQYSVTGDELNTKFAQNGGGIADADLAGKYFNEIVATIKSKLPNAKIAVDISPWMNDKITAWYNKFDKSKVDYLFTSGGRTQGNQSRIRSDNNNLVTWAGASAAMGGKKIIADDGYGVGGASNSDYQDWMNVSNLNSRIADGVIGITVQEPNSSYTSFANSNSNISTGCGTTPSSSSIAPSSSSQRSSSSQISSSSSQRSSSSQISSSSSQRSSSSSQIASSSSRSSSSSAPSSSSSVGSGADWEGQNAQLTNESNDGVSIGSGPDWNLERIVIRNLGVVESGVSYTLSFDADVSRGGAALDVQIALGPYCQSTETITAELTNVKCSFTATATETVKLTLAVPGTRWETLTISNLELLGPDGSVIGGPSAALPIGVLSSSLDVRLRSGKIVTWSVPQGAHVQIFDILGNRVQTFSASTALDLSRFPAGLYVVRVQKGVWSNARRFDNF